MSFCRNAAVGVSIAVVSLGVAAQGAISAIAASIQGGVEVLKIDFDEPLASAPTGFSTQSPARVALDFQGVGNMSGKTFHEVNLGNLKSVNVVQAGERSRVVLNLKSATSYRTDIQGKTLVLSLDPVTGATSSSAPSVVHFSDGQNSDVLPLKDVAFQLEKTQSQFINSDNLPYFADLKENCLAVMEEIDANKQILEGMANLYYAIQGQRMNEIMKVLTVVSAIFIPLTFIVGVYGMNFKYMPELEYKYGYYTIVAIMFIISISLLLFFVKRGWLKRK